MLEVPVSDAASVSSPLRACGQGYAPLPAHKKPRGRQKWHSIAEVLENYAARLGETWPPGQVLHYTEICVAMQGAYMCARPVCQDGTALPSFVLINPPGTMLLMFSAPPDEGPHPGDLIYKPTSQRLFTDARLSVVDPIEALQRPKAIGRPPPIPTTLPPSVRTKRKTNRPSTNLTEPPAEEPRTHEAPVKPALEAASDEAIEAPAAGSASDTDISRGQERAAPVAKPEQPTGDVKRRRKRGPTDPEKVEKLYQHLIALSYPDGPDKPPRKLVKEAERPIALGPGGVPGSTWDDYDEAYDRLPNECRARRKRNRGTTEHK